MRFQTSVDGPFLSRKCRKEPSWNFESPSDLVDGLAMDLDDLRRPLKAQRRI